MPKKKSDTVVVVRGQFSIQAYPLNDAQTEWCFVVSGFDERSWLDLPKRVRETLAQDAVRRYRLERSDDERRKDG